MKCKQVIQISLRELLGNNNRETSFRYFNVNDKSSVEFVNKRECLHEVKYEEICLQKIKTGSYFIIKRFYRIPRKLNIEIHIIR